MTDLPRPQLLACALVVLAVLAFAFRQAGGGEPDATASAHAPIRVDRGAGSGDGGARRLTVHVAGAVRRPGVYRMREGARVDDAVQRAGGATRRAELTQVNLAAELEDGRQVVVPLRAPAAPSGGAIPAAAGGAAAPTAPVNLNTRHRRAAGHARRRRAGDGPEDPPVPDRARGLHVSRGARPDPGDRRGAARGAAGAGDGVTATAASARAALDVVRAHPRHLVLFALVGGLLCGGWAPEWTPAPAVLAIVVAGRAGVAVIAAAAVLAGAATASARRDAIDHGPRPAPVGRSIDGRPDAAGADAPAGVG